MKALSVQMIHLYLVFQFVEGHCHGSQLILGKCHERRLIPLAFFALLFKNELQYHYLNARANSVDDVAISCKNLGNFCLVTPEIMKLIWERQVRHGQKTGVFRWISADIVDVGLPPHAHRKTGRCKARRAAAWGPKNEAEAGVRFLGRGQPAPSPPARGLWERCKRSQGRSPAQNWILVKSEGKRSHLVTIWWTVKNFKSACT